jgi:hypothetical protein
MSKDLKQYGTLKISLLKKYISKSEELLSGLAAWESLNDILNDRDCLIEELQIIEDDFQKSLEQVECSQKQKEKIDHLMQLIFDIDADCKKMIQQENKKVMDELKINQESQKVLAYGFKTSTENGMYLDYKK